MHVQAVGSVLAMASCLAGTFAAVQQSGVVTVERHLLARHVRATGTVQPIEVVTIPVPQSDEGQLILTKIVPSGTVVKAGEIVAEFDRTGALDRARTAKAKFEDLLHQVEQRQAQQQSDREKRAAEIQQADAAIGKAELELRKGPLLSEIDRLKQESKLEDAKAHLASLRRSGLAHERAEAADLKILELQRDRQKRAMERATLDADRLQLRAPGDGIIAQGVVWRRDGPGHPQEGDQLWAGQALVRLFSSGETEVQVSIGEPDGAALAPGTQALVRLDAYPDVVFKAHLDSASPVASALMDSSVRTFSARYRLESIDPRLLPDLSAAVDVDLRTPGPVLAVPRRAVQFRKGRAYVIAVTASGSRQERPVDLGAFDDSYIEIRSGLAEGDRVLVEEAQP